MMSAEIALLAVALLTLSGLLSGTETGLYRVSRVRLNLRREQGNSNAQLLTRLLQPIGPTIIALLIANNLVNQAMTTVIEHNLRGLGEVWSIILTIAVVTPLVLIFGEFLPKYLFHRHADSWIYRAARPLMLLRLLLALPVLLVQATVSLLELISGRRGATVWEPHTSRTNLRTFLKAETSGTGLSPMQAHLVDRVLALERIDLRYSAVSRPLSTIATLDGAAIIATARAGLGPTYYQRYLVTDHHDATPVGYIAAVDLLCADDSAQVADLARPLPQLPPSTPLHQAIQHMHDEGVDLCLIKGDEPRIAFRGDCVRVLAGLDE
ncbi:MAG: CNNM domain-containing protein [Planctomycetota bacterium]|jgi:CBS domain containing-hemolysin-like protein